jgi:nitrite reductase/ring-hydroxylating ferredoxin subunit
MSIADAPSRITWHRVLTTVDELPEGRVRTVTAGRKSIALTHYGGRFGALDNRCPHQGGPLGEGSIENGNLRCPWHGYDYCPLTGSPPGDWCVSGHRSRRRLRVRRGLVADRAAR